MIITQNGIPLEILTDSLNFHEMLTQGFSYVFGFERPPCPLCGGVLARAGATRRSESGNLVFSMTCAACSTKRFKVIACGKT